MEHTYGMNSSPDQGRAGFSTRGVLKLWAVITGVAFLLHLRFYEQRALIAESAVYLAFLLLLARSASLQALLGVLGRRRRVFLVGLVGIMIGGQLVDRSGWTFPFVDWSMYAYPPDHLPKYYEYTGVMRSGAETESPFGGMYDSRRIRWKLKGLARRQENADTDDQRKEAKKRYERMLGDAAAEYNRRHPEDPLRTVRVRECIIPLDGISGRSAITSRLFFEMLID